MYRIISCKVYHMTMYYVLHLSRDKPLKAPAIWRFLPFRINMSFYTDVFEYLLCHSQETLDGVRSLPLEDGTFCQPGTTRPQFHRLCVR